MEAFHPIPRLENLLSRLMRLFKQLFLPLLLLFFVAPLFGQIPGGGGFGNTRGQTGGSPQGEFVEVIDTFGVQYFYVDNPNDETPFADTCLLYTSPSPRDLSTSRMPSSA